MYTIRHPRTLHEIEIRSLVALGGFPDYQVVGEDGEVVPDEVEQADAPVVPEKGEAPADPKPRTGGGPQPRDTEGTAGR